VDITKRLERDRQGALSTGLRQCNDSIEREKKLRRFSLFLFVFVLDAVDKGVLTRAS
jgi:hypothetical protein